MHVWRKKLTSSVKRAVDRGTLQQVEMLSEFTRDNFQAFITRFATCRTLNGEAKSQFSISSRGKG